MRDARTRFVREPLPADSWDPSSRPDGDHRVCHRDRGRYGGRLRPGDIAGLFFFWYATTRFTLESLRADNWTFFGVPKAMIVSAIVIVAAIVVLVLRHRSDVGRAAPEPSA